MVGQLRSVVLDCPNPSELASFYEKLLGAERLPGDDETWVVIVANGTRLAFQLAPEYQPPTFPDPHGSQQFHLDVLVEDIEEAEPKALELGARLVQKDNDDTFRVYSDPVGHTFCLVWLS
ncbi:VOC family protein [Lentzea sp. BCCO 10_0798]|jgi:catechol-2,3-dioxygenase|uniref:VOC family protein n=1 Tax=Lentzea kristufekii TaxID=3095430 RepID=A0ABU4TPV2_9PSEU|nr:VOC family protein [Lentzea sp. BCCO 10_0798]MDX8050128.1 VOC family protein [Lentzea sp. BCCO 10_0798]